MYSMPGSVFVGLGLCSAMSFSHCNAGAFAQKGGSPTTPGCPGKQVNPFVPSRNTISLPFSSRSTTLAAFAMFGGAAESARAILVSFETACFCCAVAVVPDAMRRLTTRVRIRSTDRSSSDSYARNHSRRNRHGSRAKPGTRTLPQIAPARFAKQPIRDSLAPDVDSNFTTEDTTRTPGWFARPSCPAPSRAGGRSPVRPEPSSSASDACPRWREKRCPRTRTDSEYRAFGRTNSARHLSG